MKSNQDQKAREVMILKELVAINVSVRGNDDRSTIAEFARVLTDELAKFDYDTVRAALKEHPRRSDWNPKLREIIALCNEISASRHHQRTLDQARLPSPAKITDEQLEINRKALVKVRERLSKKYGLPTRVTRDPSHAAKVREQARMILAEADENQRAAV